MTGQAEKTPRSTMLGGGTESGPNPKGGGKIESGDRNTLDTSKTPVGPTDGTKLPGTP